MAKTKISPVLVKPYGPSAGGFAGWQRQRIVTTGNLGNIAQYARRVQDKCGGSKSASAARMCLTEAVRGGGR